MYKCLSNSSGNHGGVTGECPRCSKLVNMTHSGTTRVLRATLEHMIDYAEEHDSVNFSDLMILMAYGEARYLPIELLENDVDRVHRLVQWGMLNTRKEGQVYSMTRSDQQALRLTMEGESHECDCPCPACTSDTFALRLAYNRHWRAAALTLRKYKIFCTLRLLSRCIFLLLRSHGHLKADLNNFAEEGLVTLLTVVWPPWEQSSFALLAFTFSSPTC